MTADKDGITPLMLASRGAEPSITEKIISLIPPEKLREALNAKDTIKNRTPEMWNKMDPTQLAAEFRKIDVEGTKAYNHPYNHLFARTPYVGRFDFTAEQLHLFDFSISDYPNAPRHSDLTATKQNAEKFLTELPNISAKDGGTAAQKSGLREQLEKMISGLSEQSLIELYESRQLANQTILLRAMHSLTPTETPHQDSLQTGKGGGISPIRR